MRYKVYYIPKRNGRGLRTIAQPTPEVKALQRWASVNVLAQFPVHPAATAYRPGTSIAHNAARHLDSRFLLKMDFSGFFNSIKAEDLLLHFEKHGSSYNIPDRVHLCRILFWRPKDTDELILSIGAPSSPLVSNILMYDFDLTMGHYARDLGVQYTRYADDLTFSCGRPDILRCVESGLPSILSSLAYPKLSLNREKTIHASRKSRRSVTGLILTNADTLSLGRERKRLIRAMVHRHSQGLLSRQELLSLRGWLSFINSVEPSFVDSLLRTYGPETIGSIWRA